MGAWMNFIVIVIIYCSAPVESYSRKPIKDSKHFGLCDIYTREEYENLDEVADCRSCVSVSDKYYCMKWDCPEISCNNPVYTEQCCPSCPDTCSYRSRVFDVDPSYTFRCVDGYQTCVCLETGKVKQISAAIPFDEEIDRALSQCYWKRDELYQSI